MLGSADDVAQEVCVAVVSALGSYQPAGLSFRAFVYGIAAHKVADAFRAIARNRTEPHSRQAAAGSIPPRHSGTPCDTFRGSLTEVRMPPRTRPSFRRSIETGTWPPP